MNKAIAPDVVGLLDALRNMPGWTPLGQLDPEPAFFADGLVSCLTWRRYVARVARAAAVRGLVEVRRSAAGVQLRLTSAGRAAREARQRAVATLLGD